MSTGQIECRYCGETGPVGSILPGLCPVGRGGVHEPHDMFGPIPPVTKTPPTPEVSEAARTMAMRRRGGMKAQPEVEPVKAMPPSPPPPGSICPCCDQRVAKPLPHRMDSAKCRMLALIAEEGRVLPGGWVEVKAGRFAGYNGDDQVHAMRLEWFGLVEHGPRRSGMYRITPQGIAFLQGKHAVPVKIWCRRGKVIDQTPETVTIGSVKDVVLDAGYWDNYPNCES